jgi:hypothetical protein
VRASVALLLAAFFVGTVGYWTAGVAWWGAPDARALLTVYVRLVRAGFETFAFYLLAVGTDQTYVTQRARTANVTENSLVSTLYAFWPLSDRIWRQLYPCERAVEATRVPRALEALLDPEFQKLVEVAIASSVIRAVDVAIAQQPIQTVGKIALYRSWFRSEIVRRVWLYQRNFEHAGTLPFVEQNLYKNSPRPRYDCYARAMRRPVLTLVLAVSVAFAVGCAMYWLAVSVPWFAATYLASAYERLDVFSDLWESYYLSLAFLLFAFDNRARAADAAFTFENVQPALAAVIAVGQFPESVRLLQQTFPCSAILAEISTRGRVLDEAKRAAFESAGCTTVFLALEAGLLLAWPALPEPYFLRIYRSAFCSPIVRRAWHEKRAFFAVEVAERVDREVLRKRGCTNRRDPPDDDPCAVCRACGDDRAACACACDCRPGCAVDRSPAPLAAI